MLEWRGEQIKRNTQRAVRLGIDETTAACVREAKSNAPRVTTAYHGSIQMRPAVPDGSTYVGRWGSFSILYAIFIELGTRAHVIKPKTKKALFWPGAGHPVSGVHHPGTKANPVLTNAAEKEYPKLAGRIRRHM